MMNKVKLIALSQPSAVTDCNTAGELVAYTARVSNPANQNNTKTASKLLGYLIREDHWSPFEMVHLTMEITTTRDIARQIIRHRSFAFQEFSQRYAEQTNFTTRECRLQDEKNRQNSVQTDDRVLKEWFTMEQSKVKNDAVRSYNQALEKGIAKEQARALLPEGMTESVLYMAGSLRSWIHYCQLRMGNGTQKEHMVVAENCWEIIKAHFPSVVEALDD